MLRRCALPALFLVILTNCLWSQEREADVRSGIFRGMKVTYTWIPSKDNVHSGKAIYQGDIILDHVQEIPKQGPIGNSLGVAYSQYLWPKVGSVYQVPYIIDPSSGDVTNLNTAIAQFNSNFEGVIQFIARTTESDYVNFSFDPNNLSGVCEAYEGRVGGEQTVGGSGACTVATILHEMGHTVGVWHEQTRPDRNTYISVNYSAIIKASRSNFDQMLDNDQMLTLYDYASVMEYPAFSFTRNGLPAIETIPAGIPLSSNGYSAGDVDGIMRLYGAIPSAVTVTSNPPGLQVTVDGTTVTTPQVFNWALNSTHTFNVASAPQTINGINYVYGRWNDATAASHSITVTPGNNTVSQPATSPAVTVYSANFIQLVPYVNTISPTGAGSVATSPSPQSYPPLSGVYYIIRQPVTLTATPSGGQNFYNFINSPFWLPGANGANPKTFNVMDDGSAINLTTYFTSFPVYTVTTNPLESNYWILVDNNYMHAPANFALPYDSTWTASSSHSIGTYSPQYPWSSNSRFAFSSWSDSGAETHSVTLPSSGGATYTASITPQYYVTDYPLESCAASIGVTPGSPTGDGFYPTGSLLSFSETPNAGWILTGWLYDLSGIGNPQNLTVSDEVLVAADYSTTSTRLQLNSISPPSASAGGAAFTLTINGQGFTSSTAAYIGGFYRQPTFISSTQITVPIQASDIATAGAFQVAVGNFPSGASCAAYVPTTFYVLINTGGGTGTATVNPKSLAFGNLAAGTVSSSKTVTLTNSGSGALTISSITASGDFSESNNCAGSLAANSSCTVNVTFNPSTVGAITGGLTFSDSATTSPQLVKLTGTGITPLTFSPTSLTLPSTAVGQTSNATLTVTNNQAATTSLSTAASGNYAVTGGTCGSSLAGGGSCTVIVTFAPQYKGTIKGALSITTNGAFSPVAISLTGTATGGAAPALKISPTALTFTAEGIGATSAPKTVTVTNKSAGAISITGLSASADFTAVGSGSAPCGGTLAKSGTCTLSVTFTPSNIGAIKGAVSIASTGAGSPQVVGVSGTGQVPVTVAPTSLTFAAQTVGTTSPPKSITLTNNSGGALAISSIVASGDFAAAPSGSAPCGAAVAAGETCTFSVTFTPNVKGSISGAATVTDGAPLSPAVIKLAGKGQ